MKLRTCLLFYFFLSFNLINLYPQNQNNNDWELKKDKDGVRVFTRKVKSSDFKEFRGEVFIKCTLGSLAKIIDDISSYPKWMYNCSYAERIKKISLTEGYSYYVNHSPWPVMDRDAVIHYILTQDKNTKIINISLNGEPNFLPVNKKYVRIPSLHGFWQFIPLNNGIVKVVYQNYSETGGAVPASLANPFAVDLPFYTLLNLKEKLNNTPEGNIKLPGIIMEP
jgi:hypothetical protein